MKRRTVLASISSLATLSVPALAQGLDGSRFIKIVVPVPPGGPLDVQARALAQELTKILDTSVIVENKPGASTLLGSTEVARALPDGRTLLYTSDQSVTQTPHTLLKPPFDPQRDLVPVMRTATVAAVLLMHPSIPGTSVRELVEYAKQNPGKLSYASFGPGSPPHVYGELLAKTAGLDMTHVPYKGVGDAVADLLTGRVQLTFSAPTLAAQYVPDGKLKAIGIVGEKRSRLLPNIPTMLEQGYTGFEITNWFALFVPAGTKPDVIKKLRSALIAAMKQPAVLAAWKQMAFDFPDQDETLADANRIMKRDYEKWGQFIRGVGIQPQ
jgi:tripartite-type tricarboxylate transporter receptor subunit TctC